MSDPDFKPEERALFNATNIPGLTLPFSGFSGFTLEVIPRRAILPSQPSSQSCWLGTGAQGLTLSNASVDV